MKKTTFLKSNLAIYILWIVSFIVVVSFFLMNLPTTSSISKSNVVVNNSSALYSASYKDTLKPVDIIISTSLPYDTYNRKKDSVNIYRSFKNGKFNTNVFSPIGGATARRYAMDKDLGKKSFSVSSANDYDSYFYIVRGWKIKTDENNLDVDNSYYVNNGVPYFRKYILKSTKGNHSNWEMTEKRLNYFYEKDGKTILIPISKNTYTYAKYATIFLIFVFTVIFLVCVMLGFKILYNISRGKVFTEENIKMFRQATLITILTPLLIIFIVISYRLLFYKYFDENVVLDIDFFKGQAYFLFVGLAVSVLYSVFKRGFNIQQENDLVV